MAWEVGGQPRSGFSCLRVFGSGTRWGGKRAPAGAQETESLASNVLCYLGQVPIQLWAAGPRFLYLEEKVFDLDVERWLPFLTPPGSSQVGVGKRGQWSRAGRAA